MFCNGDAREAMTEIAIYSAFNLPIYRKFPAVFSTANEHPRRNRLTKHTTPTRMSSSR
ncbi:hypothetical protein RRSWK_03766 [Rhodopirellula sp. SWK7]|nr:hypothetical protein RRSWK_03766 [Rhodopirellula sp. SWK7]